MDVSRRAFVASAGALGMRRPGPFAVDCSLEESRAAYRTACRCSSPVLNGRPWRPPQAGSLPHLVESSAGFVAEDLSWLNRWGISVERPREVRGPAWVRYNWPVPVLIRDFGRICPIRGGTVIARLEDVPVAVRRGRFIVLGSPLGPHVYAGDPDACRLLQSMIRSFV